jgi:hypothetical protein
MPSPELTAEDQLVADLVAHLIEERPTGLPEAIPILHFGRVEKLPVPAVIIGHEGSERVPLQEETVWATLRIALRTSADDTPQATHRLQAGSLADAMRLLARRPGPLPLTYLHDIQRQSGTVNEIDDDRREITIFTYRVLITRMEQPEPEPEE